MPKSSRFNFAHLPRPILLLALASVAIAIGLVLLPWSYPLYLDAAAYTAVGRAWVEDGLIPYRDMWEAKPPLALLLNGLAGSAGAATPLGVAGGVRLLSTISAAGAGLALGAVLRSYGVRRALAVAGVLATTILLTSPMHANGGGLTEVPAFAAGFAAWALALRSSRPTSHLVVGALAAVALAIHPQSLPLVAMAGLSLITTGSSRAAAARSIGLALLGGLFVAAAIAGYFLAHDALDDMLRVVLGYNSAFAAVTCPIPGTTGWPCYSEVDFSASIIWHALIIVPPLVAAGLALATRRGLAASWPLLTFVLLMAGMALPVVRRSPTTHYMWPLLLAALVIVCMGAEVLLRRMAAGGSPRLRLVAICLVVGLPVSASTVGVISATRTAGALDASDIAAVEFVNDLPDEQPLFVWGTASSMYEISRRPAAGRFVHLFPLMLPGYTDAGLVRQACEVLARGRPVIIDDNSSIGLELTDNVPGGIDAAWFAPLRTMLAEHWTLASEIGENRVWTPTDLAALPSSTCD